MGNLSHDVGCVSDAISDAAEKLHTLRQLVDASSATAEKLCTDMQAMTSDERFNGVMEIWRNLSKIGTAATWIGIHHGTVIRHTNYLIDATAREEA
jgi:hypothetical protein